MQGEVTQTPETDGQYLGWYLRHTIRNVSNPTEVVQDRFGYQNLGAVNNLMVHGLAYAYQGPPEDARDRISQVMNVANQQHWLDLPTSLTTQPAEPRVPGNAPQRVRRQRNRRRHNNIVEEEEEDPPNYLLSTPSYQQSSSSYDQPTPSFRQSSPSYEQSPPRFPQPTYYEAGISSQMLRFGNYDKAGTSSNLHQTTNIGGGFFPHSEHLFSSTPSYTSFGGVPMSYTLTLMGPHFSQDDSAPNVYGVGSSEVVPPRFSDVTPLPLGFSDDVTLGRRQSQRDIQPTRCFTGGLLFPHQDPDHEHGRGRGRGRGSGFQPWGQYRQ